MVSGVWGLGGHSSCHCDVRWWERITVILVERAVNRTHIFAADIVLLYGCTTRFWQLLEATNQTRACRQCEDRD